MSPDTERDLKRTENGCIKCDTKENVACALFAVRMGRYAQAFQ